MTDRDAIENLKNYIESLMEDYGYHKDIVEFRDSVEHLEKTIKAQQEEIEEYERTLDIFDNREYRKRYLEEERAKRPKLLYPDADEIYKRYFEQKEEIEILKCNNEILQGELDRIGTKALKLEAGSSTDDVIAEIEKKDRQLEIKDKYLELIYFLGVDYDGWNTVESLKSLIDNLIDYVKKAGNNDDKAPIYSNFNGENLNILYERLDNKGDIENG